MSATPPDRPTEPLRPRGPVPPVEQRLAPPPGVDPNVILLRLEDTVASLRTGLMVVGLIAVLALGFAVYALVSGDDDASGGSRSGLASDARVSRLDDRIDRLSRQVQDLRSANSSDGDVTDRVDKLEQSVKDLESREDPAAAIKDLSDRVDTLSQDVQQLQQSQP